jgi:hypothetical protein
VKRILLIVLFSVFIGAGHTQSKNSGQEMEGETRTDSGHEIMPLLFIAFLCLVLKWRCNKAKEKA